MRVCGWLSNRNSDSPVSMQPIFPYVWSIYYMVWIISIQYIMSIPPWGTAPNVQGLSLRRTWVTSIIGTSKILAFINVFCVLRNYCEEGGDNCEVIRSGFYQTYVFDFVFVLSLSLSLSYLCLCLLPIFVFVFVFVFEKETGTDLEAIVRIAGEPLHAFIKFSTGRQFVNGAAGQKEPFPEPVIKWRFITHIGCNLTVRKRVHTIHQTFPTRMNCKICQSRAIIREIG